MEIDLLNQQLLKLRQEVRPDKEKGRTHNLVQLVLVFSFRNIVTTILLIGNGGIETLLQTVLNTEN